MQKVTGTSGFTKLQFTGTGNLFGFRSLPSHFKWTTYAATQGTEKLVFEW
jgi:hypothetical protein